MKPSANISLKANLPKNFKASDRELFLFPLKSYNTVKTQAPIVHISELLVYICFMKIETDHLLTVKNYAKKEKVAPTYIYRLIRNGTMKGVLIDGVLFIDTKVFPTIPR